MATRDVVERRIRMCQEALKTRLPEWQIKEAIRSECPKLSARQISRYLKKATERNIKETDKSAEEHTADAYNLYNEIARDPQIHPGIRLKAQEDIVELFGLKKPVVNINVEITSFVAQLNDISDEQLEQIIAGAEAGLRRPGKTATRTIETTAALPAPAVSEAENIP